jgi:tetratricopeptide (TPR) repeat protein
MNDFWLGLLSAAFATNQVVAVSNHVAQTTGIHLPLVDPNSPAEVAFDRLLEADQDALDEVDRWILEERRFADQGAGMNPTALRARIAERFKPVEQAYRDHLKEHPGHIRARLALGSFLNEQGREQEAVAEWEKARELAPNNPASWNNLANHFAHRGPIVKALEFYEKAVELNPAESVYRRNQACVVFLFRKDAREYYELPDDQAVLWKSLAMYQDARRLAPQDFSLASEVAQVYYFLKPRDAADPDAARKLTDESLRAWQEAMALAEDDLVKQGVKIHMTRVCLNAGRLDEARRHLADVTNPAYDMVRRAQVKRLARLESGEEDIGD